MDYTKIQTRMLEEFGVGRLKADMNIVAWFPDDSVMVVIPRELFRLDVNQWGNRVESLPVLMSLPFDGELFHPSDVKCSYTPLGVRKAIPVTKLETDDLKAVSFVKTEYLKIFGDDVKLVRSRRDGHSMVYVTDEKFEILGVICPINPNTVKEN